MRQEVQNAAIDMAGVGHVHHVRRGRNEDDPRAAGPSSFGVRDVTPASGEVADDEEAIDNAS